MKDKLIHVTDAETLNAIERNGFGDPIDVGRTADGAWVPEWSLQQFRLLCLHSELGSVH